MTPIQIIGFIMGFTGKRPADFAIEHGETVSSIYRVASGEMSRGQTTERVRKLIAKTIHKQESDIWPEKEVGEEKAA